MSELIPMIATLMVAVTLGRLAAWPTIHRLRIQVAEARWQVQHDPLTGLLNRAGLTAAHTVWQQHDEAMILLLIDLDDFKAVNDTYGHDAGDEVLIGVADAITDAADLHGGIAARLAGDEFAVLLPVRRGELARPVDAIVRLISTPVTVTTDTATIKLTASASAGACWGEGTDTLEVLLRRADLALYHAKNTRSPYTLYEHGMTMPGNVSRRGARLRERHARPEAAA